MENKKRREECEQRGIRNGFVLHTGAKIYYEIPLLCSRWGLTHIHTHTLALARSHSRKGKKGKSGKKDAPGHNRDLELSWLFILYPIPHQHPLFTPTYCLVASVAWQIESAKLNKNDIALKLNSTEMPKTSLGEASLGYSPNFNSECERMEEKWKKLEGECAE